MPVTLRLIHSAIAQLEAQGQPVTAQAVWHLVRPARRTTVQQLFKEAVAQRTAQAAPPAPVPAPDDVPPVAPEDPERLALAAQIAALQAQLAALGPPPAPPLQGGVVGLEQISTFAPPALAAPACAVTSELARFRNAYRVALAKVPASTALHDPVRREQGAIAYDFHTRCKEVRRRLAQARQRAGQWDARRAVVAFVGQEEAARLLATTEEPRWTLED